MNARITLIVDWDEEETGIKSAMDLADYIEETVEKNPDIAGIDAYISEF